MAKRDTVSKFTSNPIPIPSRKGTKMKARNPIVIHYVHDMDRAKDFYSKVFDVKPSVESPGWTMLDFGAIQRRYIYFLPMVMAHYLTRG